MYSDRDDAVTKLLPILTFNDEYKMPQIGSHVLVVHLSNGSELGYILGGYWNIAHAPGKTGKGVFRKEYGSKPGMAYCEYNDENKILKIHSDKIVLSCADGEITVEEIIRKLANL